MAFVTTPGTTLSNPTLPIVYTETNAVVAISAAFGAEKVEERVYRDGTFRYPYLRSTKVGTTYTIVRDGGWPTHPELFVDEATPAPTTFWTTLYEADLRTYANYTPSSNAVDVTLDGQPWWLHGHEGLGASQVEARFVSGQGLRLKGANGPSGGNNYAGAYGGLRVHDMPGYDPAKYVAVQFRFGGALSGLTRVGTRMHTGGSAWGGPAIGATTQRWYPGNNSSELAFWSSNFSLSYSRSVLTEVSLNSTLDDVVLAVVAMPWGSVGSRLMHTKWRTHLMLRQHVATGMPAIESMLSFGAANDEATGESANYRIGAWASGENGLNLRTAHVTHVRVLQKAA